MENQERNVLAVAAAGAVAVVGAVGLSYVRTMRVERAKRAKIKAWEQENLACIQNYRTRLMSMLDGPNPNLDDFWQAYHEESEFLNIIVNRPMY